MRRAVLHLDLDAFFAALEQRDKPSLRGKPVVVGGLGWRGVVATASYEARAFDVGSAMPTALARRRCPNAAYLVPRFEAYRQASRRVMELIREVSRLVEPLSLDEAYVDLSELELTQEAARTLAQELRARILAETGLTASVGLATNKLLAKVASDLGKPDGCVVVAEGSEAAVLAPLSVRALPGVGTATQARLATLAVGTVGQLAAADERELVALLGKAAGSALHAAARGVDARPVVSEREAKSVSAEQTFAADLVDRAALEVRVAALAGRVGERLAEAGLSGRTVTLKVRRYDFATTGRSVTLGRAVSGPTDIAAAARSLLAAVDVSDGVRLLGVGVSGLTDHVQEDLLAVLQAQEEAPHDAPALEAGGVPDAGGQEDVVVVPDPSAEVTSAVWLPGQDVVHVAHGPGWVQGSGLGRVTVRFEGPHTGVGRVRTLAVDDVDLAPAEPPSW